MVRCPQCRTRRATYSSLLTHVLKSGHKQCDCGGYHYKHRPGNPLCKENVFSSIRHAMLVSDLTDGEVLDAMAEILWDAKSKTTGPCPF